jgi:2-C-methyl-D-erythritol 4-phosphate cytidylyltransferase
MVAGAPVVTHALRALDAAGSVDAIVLVCAPDLADEFREMAVARPGIVKVTDIVAGGATRQLSVAAGLAALPDGTDVVIIHDGARPLVAPETIDGAVTELEASGADGVVVGHRSFDTVKSVGPRLEVSGTPDRSSLWVAQTPQVFRRRALVDAHERAVAESWECTDDASLVERSGGRVRMFEGPRWNIKVTVADDLIAVAALLASRIEEGRG